MKNADIRVEFTQSGETRDSVWVRLLVPDQSLADFCLAFVLLHHEAVKKIVLRPSNQANNQNIQRIEICVGKKRYGEEIPDGIRLTVNDFELENWMLFFLDYYHEGVSSTDHFDVCLHRKVDVPFDASLDRMYCVTFQVTGSADSVDN